MKGKKKMKSYKDYSKTYIGGSDSARLTLKTSDAATEPLYFGKDGDYSAYIINEYTPVPEHYHKRFECHDSLEIYNDFGELEWSAKAKNISVYTAGNFGCLIKLEGAENYKFDIAHLTWDIIHESDDENGKPSLWATEIDHKDYGRFAWIVKYDDNTYSVEVENKQKNGYNKLFESNTLYKAQKWAFAEFTRYESQSIINEIHCRKGVER